MPASASKRRWTCACGTWTSRVCCSRYAEDDVTALAAAFQQAYHGDARPIVDAFGAAQDKREWAREVEAQVASEIGVDFRLVAGDALAGPSPSVTASVVLPDEVVALPVTCDECGESFEVQCARPDVAAMVTEHTFMPRVRTDDRAAGA